MIRVHSQQCRGKLLVTGGAGYIGSHLLVELLNSGYSVVVLDNLSQSETNTLRQVEQLTGQSVELVVGDVQDALLLRRVFADYQIEAVLHLAGLKVLHLSLCEPLLYYLNNVAATLTLCRVMADAGVFRLIFSSSAAVYGQPSVLPVVESCPVSLDVSPYARSKLMIEACLQDLVASGEPWSIAVLRYFNPLGAHPSGCLFSECWWRVPGLQSHLLLAAQQDKPFTVYQPSKPTNDATGIRDFIHVVDLAKGHLAALAALERYQGFNCWNLGRGCGSSVLEVVNALEKVIGHQLALRWAAAPSDEVPECWAGVESATKDLGWSAELGLSEMMQDAWQAYMTGRA